MELADQFVNNPNAPNVKVCGTGISMTVFLLGRCNLGRAGSAHSWTIGKCDSTQRALLDHRQV